jgi:hypothetical protein
MSIQVKPDPKSFVQSAGISDYLKKIFAESVEIL